MVGTGVLDRPFGDVANKKKRLIGCNKGKTEDNFSTSSVKIERELDLDTFPSKGKAYTYVTLSVRF